MSFDPGKGFQFQRAMLCHQPGIGPQKFTFKEKHFPSGADLAIGIKPSGAQAIMMAGASCQLNPSHIKTIATTAIQTNTSERSWRPGGSLRNIWH